MEIVLIISCVKVRFGVLEIIKKILIVYFIVLSKIIEVICDLEKIILINVIKIIVVKIKLIIVIFVIFEKLKLSVCVKIMIEVIIKIKVDNM